MQRSRRPWPARASRCRAAAPWTRRREPGRLAQTRSAERKPRGSAHGRHRSPPDQPDWQVELACPAEGGLGCSGTRALTMGKTISRLPGGPSRRPTNNPAASTTPSPGSALEAARFIASVSLSLGALMLSLFGIIERMVSFEKLAVRGEEPLAAEHRDPLTCRSACGTRRSASSRPPERRTGDRGRPGSGEDADRCGSECRSPERARHPPSRPPRHPQRERNRAQSSRSPHTRSALAPFRPSKPEKRREG